MNAILKPITQAEVQLEVRFQALTADWLGRVLQIENAVYPHPWSRANFEDSIQTGYQMQVLTVVNGDAGRDILEIGRAHV